MASITTSHGRPAGILELAMFDGDRSGAAITINDVLITAELSRRTVRAPDYAAENRALCTLAQELATNPQGMLQTLVELVLEICDADSSGVSVLEAGGENGIVRWHATAGAFTPHQWSTMSRDASPCGTVIARDAVLLFNEAERFFPALRGVEPRMYESLLAPWHVDGKPAGTLWAIKHSPEGRFDAEDARILESLSHFAAATHHMTRTLDATEVRHDSLEGRIAERRVALTEAVEALRQSEDRLRLALDATAMGTFIWNMTDDHGQPDAQMLALFGLPTDSTISLTTALETMIHPDDRARYARAVELAIDPLGSGGLREEVRIMLPDETTRWLTITGRVAFAGTPRHATRMDGMAFDVSDRAEAGAALRASEERFRAIVEEATDYAIFTTDVAGRIDDWTPGAAAVFGWSDEEAIGQPMAITFTNEDRATGAPQDELVAVRDTGYAQDVRWHKHKDGSQIFIEGSARARLGADGSFQGLLKIGQDVTERRLAEQVQRDREERLREALEARVVAATAELRALSRRLLEVQEEERRYLARELHDEVGQALTGLQFQLAAAGGKGGAPALTGAMATVEVLTEQVRQLSMDLRPAVLDSFGLLPALQWYAERYQQRTGIVVDLRQTGLDCRFPPQIEIGAYRVVQEALTNVARHAQTATATVQLLAEDGTLMVVVQDSGQGFNPITTSNSSGLGGMRERVELLGGGLEIEAAHGAGVVVRAELPFARPRDTAPDGGPESERD
jgi:PAS domain S-box-containing protein